VTSRYLQYLPAVLWERQETRESLGAFLQIFEKLLTGVDDGVVVQGKNGRTYPPIEAQIARVHRLFDPSIAPIEFLDALASWVGLEFPKAGNDYLWDEFQRRKLTAGILQVYGRRGLRDGINRYLELYTVAATRPRIAVDDGIRILGAEPVLGVMVRIEDMVTLGPERADLGSPDELPAPSPGVPPSLTEGIVRPLAVAASPTDGSLFVTDHGTPSRWLPAIKPGVWRVPQDGAPPKRLGDAAFAPQFPVGVALHASSGNLYVVDATGLYEFVPPFTDATKKDIGARGPVAVCALADGHLLILDRGPMFQTGSPAVPALVDVQLQPFTVRRTPITGVVEPMSLCVTPRGQVIVGDGREQDRATPADLMIVDRGSGAATSILGATRSRLAAPVALIAEDETHILVLDLGLKPYSAILDSSLANFVRHIAEPAMLYRVTLGAAPTIEAASTTGSLVFPTGMAVARGKVFISDKGEFAEAPSEAAPRVWRAVVHEFGVAVYFAQSRQPPDAERRRILHDIQEIVEREKPAQSAWTMVFSSS
jgi:phage tail-like protein